jgi:hypothetical protein
MEIASDITCSTKKKARGFMDEDEAAPQSAVFTTGL